MKIGVKLVLIITVVNLVCISALTVSSLLYTSSSIRGIAEENAINVTEVTAGKVKSFLEVPFDEIRSLSYAMARLDEKPPELRRDFVNFMLYSLSLQSPDYIGIWAAFEPNALDDMDAYFANAPGSNAAGRFLPMFTNHNGVIEHRPLTGIETADFYNVSFRSGREAIIEPYFEMVSGQQVMVTSVTVPIKRNGQVIGVAGVDLELSEIQVMVDQIRPFGTGFSEVFSNTGMIISHPDISRLGKNAQDTERGMLGRHLDSALRAIRSGTAFDEVVFSSELNANMMTVIRPVTIGGSDTPWSVASLAPERTVMSAVYRLTTMSIIFGVAILAIITIIILITARSITAPLKAMTNVFHFIGEGDFTHTLEAKSKDEIGDISRSLNGTMVKIKDLIQHIKGDAARLSDIGIELSSNMNETAAAINQITANIQSIKGRVINQSASVSETNATMEQITINIDKLNDQVEKQAGSVTQSSSAVEEMIANVNSVTQTLVKNMENVNELTSASEIGRSGLQAVSEDIKEIARESEGLLEINSVMENIASQTNLLSMNAAIEAAHAGEAGRGFAVVADEIRKLAENSGKQSKTISAVLKKIKGSIDKIMFSTETVLENFEVITRDIKIVADQEGNIRNAMEEQGQGSKQILEAMGSLNDITRHVKTGSIEMLEGSKEVIQESKNLEGVTQEITGGMNEMASGAEQINVAVNAVNELTVKNRDSIDNLLIEVARFKIN